MIHVLDKLPNLTLALLIWLIIEVIPPVTKIAGNNKHCVFVIEIFCEGFSVNLQRFRG